MLYCEQAQFSGKKYVPAWSLALDESTQIDFKELDVFNQPLETPITIEKCTTSGGRTKDAHETAFIFVDQRGGDDVT